jgi:cobalt-zinc-cadmium efflux system protein
VSGGHGHSHGAPAGGDHRRRLALVLAITAIVLIVEVVGAILSGSLALVADAGHMLTDVAGLAIALIAAMLTLRPKTAKRTWGYQRAEVLGATAQAAILLAVGVYIFYEGIRRLFEPPEVASMTMVVFGIVGLVGNAVAIVILTRGGGGNINMRAALLEVVVLDIGTAAALGLPPTGAALVRPDGHEIARWTAADAPPKPGPAWSRPAET